MTPLLLVALFPAANGPEAFLSAARSADTDRERIACLAAWASAWTGPPPEVLEPEARAALHAVRAREGFRLYASVEAEEVRLGWVDPLDVLGRVEVILHRPDGGRTVLPSLGPRRRRLPPRAAGELELIARARDCVPGAILASTRLPLAGAAPAPPPSVERRPPTADLAGSGPIAAEAREAPFAWWWYVALGVAAAGVGLAAWEEAGG